MVGEGDDPKLVIILRNITELKKIDKEKEELETRRKRFIETTSHELRTPVTNIKGFIEFLQTRVIPSDRKNEIFRVINNNISRLELLIDDVSSLS